MFDFLKWQGWLSAKADQLRASGNAVEFRAGAGGPKPSFTIGLIGEETIADFATWNTGETDWTIMDKAKGTGTTPLAHRWGVGLNDGNYEREFAEFVSALSKFELRTPRDQERSLDRLAVDQLPADDAFDDR